MYPNQRFLTFSTSLWRRNVAFRWRDSVPVSCDIKKLHASFYSLARLSIRLKNFQRTFGGTEMYTRVPGMLHSTSFARVVPREVRGNVAHRGKLYREEEFDEDTSTRVLPKEPFPPIFPLLYFPCNFEYNFHKRRRENKEEYLSPSNLFHFYVTIYYSIQDGEILNI